MKEIILEFIHRRFPVGTGTWTSGNCYWLAFILHTAFQCDIYYLPVTGHFIAKDKEGNYYDQTGLVIFDEPCVSWEEIKNNDILWYNNLIRDCVL